MSVCLSVCLSARPSVRPSVCLSVRPSVCVSVCLLSVCLREREKVRVLETMATKKKDHAANNPTSPYRIKEMAPLMGEDQQAQAIYRLRQFVSTTAVCLSLCLVFVWLVCLSVSMSVCLQDAERANQ